MKRNWCRIVLGFAIVHAVLLYYVLFKIDIATAPTPQDLVPEIASTAYKARDLVVLVTYADGPSVFFKNQNALSASAINKGIDNILLYRRSHIDAAFYERNKKILMQERGAGYWLWKPYFILRAMNSYPDNTIIVYADSGVVFTKPLLDVFNLLKGTSKSPRDVIPAKAGIQEGQWIPAYAGMTPVNDMILVGHGKPVALRIHLKKEAQKIFAVENNQSVLNSQNIWAFFMAIRNTPQTREFVRKWLVSCENEAALTDDPYDASIQEKGFSHHEHDQSILSVLVAEQPEGKIIIKRNDLRNTYGIINNHRHPAQEYTSPLFIEAGLPQWLSDVLFNNIIMRKLRQG